MHEDEHDDAVQRVAEQDGIRQLCEPCRLGGIDVDRDQAADGEERAPDCQHALEARGGASLGSVVPKKPRRKEACGGPAGRTHVRNGRAGD